MMGCEDVRAGGGRDGNQTDGAGGGFDGAVEKEDSLRLGNVFREVGSPLLTGDCANLRLIREALFGPVGEPGADAVVSAEGVAAGED